ncbi:uncharacterized protein F5147DRAFT_427354 [Suillus discolor]|uniref:Uncharacterized protein n=1 Tax=Suillus discolor TaxID=1912936 RepID=A0A9P7EWL1_9AGAM|nr:uncharacterized protein F5147DRAFT_427354 [Suillus discolor]KAG2092654.1 hypothetical protein F5147DRAFT_427354 [Suillus discolor]
MDRYNQGVALFSSAKLYCSFPAREELVVSNMELIRLERRDTTTIATRCLVSRSDPCSCSQRWFCGLGPSSDNAHIVSGTQHLQKTRCHFDRSAGVIFTFEELVEANQNGHINSWLFVSVLLTRLLEADCTQTCIPVVPVIDGRGLTNAMDLPAYRVIRSTSTSSSRLMAALDNLFTIYKLQYKHGTSARSVYSSHRAFQVPTLSCG